MTRIQLEAASDLVRQLAYESQPVKAVIELIWNGLDADAHRVTVTIGRDEMGAVVGVTVDDDGHGMIGWTSSPPWSTSSSTQRQAA